MGNGRRGKLWKDKWCGDELLSLSFTSLYALAVSKDAWVAVFYGFMQGKEPIGTRVSLDL